MARIRRLVAGLEFIEGRATAGEMLHKAKNNQQIPWDHPMRRAMERVNRSYFNLLRRHAEP